MVRSDDPGGRRRHGVGGDARAALRRASGTASASRGSSRAGRRGRRAGGGRRGRRSGDVRPAGRDSRRRGARRAAGPTCLTSRSRPSTRPARPTSTRRWRLERRRRRLARRLRDRRRPGVRRARRPGRRRGAAARPDPLRPGPAHAAAPRGAQRGRRRACSRTRPRPAFVWRFDLDADGAVEHLDLVRALVRCRRRLDYGQVQAAADAHPASDGRRRYRTTRSRRSPCCCARSGAARRRRSAPAAARACRCPSRTSSPQDGRYRVVLRPALPVGGLERPALADDRDGRGGPHARRPGRPAADAARTGRTPSSGTAGRPPRSACPGRRDEPYGEFLRAARPGRARATSRSMHEAGALFRGRRVHAVRRRRCRAVRTHAAVAAPYAHVTAPLRRLVDRFGLARQPRGGVRRRRCPGWVRDALPQLPGGDGGVRPARRRARAARASTLVEAAVLADRVGQVFDAVAVDVGKDGTSGKVQLLDPAVLVRAQGAAHRRDGAQGAARGRGRRGGVGARRPGGVTRAPASTQVRDTPGDPGVSGVVAGWCPPVDG